MKQTRMVLGVALVLALVCSSAMAVPSLTLKASVNGGAWQAGDVNVEVGDVISIGAFVENVNDLGAWSIGIDSSNMSSVYYQYDENFNPTVGSAGNWAVQAGLDAAGQGAGAGDAYSYAVCDPNKAATANFVSYLLVGEYPTYSSNPDAYNPPNPPFPPTAKVGEGDRYNKFVISGSGDLALFTMMAYADGSSTIDFITGDDPNAVILGNGITEQEITGIDFGSPLNITVGGEPVPEPATLVLLSSGLLGLVAYRRRK